MIENIFLPAVGLVWIIFASISDLRKREVPNWLSFSLIAFALAYRAFFSVINSDAYYFIYGLFGLGVFVLLGYGFYYARVFAGGDAKLLMAVGAVLPVSGLYYSMIISAVFIFLLFFCGSVYGLIWSIILALKNKNKFIKEFRKQFRINKRIFYYSLVLLLFSFILAYLDAIFISFSALILIFPFLLIYAKSVENSCMIDEVDIKNLTEGDWLYENVKVGKTIIKPDWEGLSLSELKLLKNKRGKVKVKQGIPFVPSFFFAFITLAYLLYSGVNIFGIFLTG